jgi:hypothetical protein
MVLIQRSNNFFFNRDHFKLNIFKLRNNIVSQKETGVIPKDLHKCV